LDFVGIWVWLGNSRRILYVCDFSFSLSFFIRIFFYLELKELQQMYHELVLDVQGIIESRLHLPQSSSPTVEPPPIQQTTSPGFFLNLKAKTRGRSNTNPTPEEVSQAQAQREQQAQAQRGQQSAQCKELASAFYTLNSKYRISWECAELLIELAVQKRSFSASQTSLQQQQASPTSPLGPNTLCSRCGYRTSTRRTSRILPCYR